MASAYGRWPGPARWREDPWLSASPAGWLIAYAAAGVMVSLALGAGLTLLAPVPRAAGPSSAAGSPAPHTFLNLSVVIDAVTGLPRYVPANFTVPLGELTVTIADHDAVAAWASCPCRVQGSVGDLELLNGSPVASVPTSNVAHTFSVPQLGLSIFSPGESVVSFTVWLNETGSFEWLCLAPCGQGDPYTGPPMGVPGYMVGTLTVA